MSYYGSHFAMSCTLKGPICTHTGETHYRCDVCGAQFVHSSDVTKYIRSHTGKKPFKCDMCSAQFAHNGDLKKIALTLESTSITMRCAVPSAHTVLT